MTSRKKAKDIEKVHINEFDPDTMPMSCTWIVIGPPATGKCLGFNTPVLMHDCSIKLVQNIITGDRIMGDDILPRNVLSTTSGVDTMYRIDPSDGTAPYVVNAPHILCLFDINGNVVEISVTDYHALPNQQDYKGYRVVPPGLQPIGDITYSITVTPLGQGNYYGFQIDKNGRFLLGDYTVTHNTTFMEQMSYITKHKYPTAKVFIGTEDGYKRMQKIFHPLFVSNVWDEAEEKRHIIRQRTCKMENGKDYVGNYAINIIDDIGDNPKQYRSPVMRGIFKLGSQHWAQLAMIGTQYSIDFPPDTRKSVSYVALGREPEEKERKKLFENFGGLAGTYDRFCDLMDQITGNYTFLIIKKRSQSNDLSECIFWFKTKPMGDWQFGCKEWRKHGDERYNKNYQEKFVL